MDIHSNFTFLGKSFYLVRTQAGFNQALKHFANEQELNRYSPFPKVYPSIVLMKMEYEGYHSIYCTVWSVREWREYVAKIEQTICESDEFHKNNKTE